ncbi:MAG: hypothetical protein LBL38_01400, partial [Lactobacillales bacterium]|nr:hypothetical protein [Lactobacillales bacterium]
MEFKEKKHRKKLRKVKKSWVVVTTALWVAFLVNVALANHGGLMNFPNILKNLTGPNFSPGSQNPPEGSATTIDDFLATQLNIPKQALDDLYANFPEFKQRDIFPEFSQRMIDIFQTAMQSQETSGKNNKREIGPTVDELGALSKNNDRLRAVLGNAMDTVLSPNDADMAFQTVEAGEIPGDIVKPIEPIIVAVLQQQMLEEQLHAATSVIFSEEARRAEEERVRQDEVEQVRLAEESRLRAEAEEQARLAEEELEKAKERARLAEETYKVEEARRAEEERVRQNE